MDIKLDIAGDAIGVTGHLLEDGRRTVPIIVVCRKDGRHAFLNSCPHAGVRLDFEPGGFLDVTGTLLQCSLHGALFEPGSGRCVAGPCKGSRLVGLKTRTDPDGRLVVENVEKIPGRAFQAR
jgi:nitrite reductase/ring-hydroxylating ferredoxin subunit